MRILALSTLAIALALGVPQGCSTTEAVREKLSLSQISGQAHAAKRKGDLDRAYELWSEYVDRRPQAHYAEYELGLVELDLGLHQDAIRHLTIAHDLRPGNTDYIEALAQAYVDADQPGQMLALLQKTQHEGGHIQGLLRLADYAQRAGFMDDARTALKKAARLDNGDSIEPHIAIANFARRTNNRRLEIAALSRALAFDPSSDAYNARFLELRVTPGPSLAVSPDTPYDF